MSSHNFITQSASLHLCFTFPYRIQPSTQNWVIRSTHLYLNLFSQTSPLTLTLPSQNNPMVIHRGKLPWQINMPTIICLGSRTPVGNPCTHSETAQTTSCQNLRPGSNLDHCYTAAPSPAPLCSLYNWQRFGGYPQGILYSESFEFSIKRSIGAQEWRNARLVSLRW